MDEPRGHRWISELRCVAGHAEVGGEPVDLHDTGMERRISIHHEACGSTWAGRGNCRFAGLERIRRTLGEAESGNEEGGMERNDCGRRKALQRRAAASSYGERTVSKYPALRFSCHDQRAIPYHSKLLR